MPGRLDYDLVVQRFIEANELPTRSAKRKYVDSHVFDEEKSVRWNREQVAINNAEADEQSRQMVERKRAAIQTAEDNIIKYLQQETGVDPTILRKLYNYIKVEIFDDGFHYTDKHIDTVEEICEIFTGTD